MESHLKWPDYMIFVGFLAISLAIGVYHSLTGGRQKTTAEFILANRRLKVIPTAISMLVSLQSAIIILGATAEMYGYGIQFLIFCTVAAILSLVFVERIIVPWLYPLKLVSIYDYLEKRFMSKIIRIYGASMGIVSGVILMGVAMYAPSAALESATGFPIAASIPVMAIVSMAYTALGGMRAVIWTDVFQFIIMMIGIIVIIVKGLIVVGGITQVFRLAEEEGRLDLANASFDPRVRNTVWSLVIGLTVNWINGYGLSQACVQRFSAVNKLAKARKTILMNIPPLIIMNAMLCFTGLIVLAYFSSIKCDPLASKIVTNPNQLLPYFVVTIFADSPGFAGLFLSTLYGGALSTVSSSLSGTAANCWEDILKWKLNHLAESKKALINKLLVMLFGILAIGLAFLAASVPGPIIQVTLALHSLAAGPLMAIFFLGAISRHANWKGTLLGGITGSLVVLWLNIGSLTLHNVHPRLPPLSVEQCFHGNSTSTLFISSKNYTNYTHESLEIVDGIDDKQTCNETTGFWPGSGIQRRTALRGAENFYALSYLWFIPLGAAVAGIVGIIASLIMRDRDLETKVDERLLMRIHCWRWSDEHENQELIMDDKTDKLLQKVLIRPDGSLLKDTEMTHHRKTENELQTNSKGT